MKAAILHSEPEILELMVTLWNFHEKNKEHLLTTIRPEALEHQSVVDLLSQNYDVVFLNLLLPQYLSFRIAEIVHLSKLNTRLVLVSATCASPNYFVPLFDAFVPALAMDALALFKTDWENHFAAKRTFLCGEQIDLAIQHLFARTPNYSEQPTQHFAEYRRIYPRNV